LRREFQDNSERNGETEALAHDPVAHAEGDADSPRNDPRRFKMLGVRNRFMPIPHIGRREFAETRTNFIEAVLENLDARCFLRGGGRGGERDAKGDEYRNDAGASLGVQRKVQGYPSSSFTPRRIVRCRTLRCGLKRLAA
jgi:hypothetical protein